MTTQLGDLIDAKLIELYGTGTGAGTYWTEWCAEHGPAWEDIVAFIESETSLPFADGWAAYWATPAEEPFDPDSLGNLGGWWKADSLVLANNDPVASWSDSSGQGNTMAQASASLRPAYKASGPNSMPYVAFDATDDILTTSSVVSTQTDDFLMIAVVREASGSQSDSAFFHNGTVSDGYGLSIRTWNTAKLGWLRGGAGWHDGTSTVDTGWNVVVLRRASGTAKVYLNGGTGQVGNTDAPSTPTTHTRLGNHGSTGKGHDIAEALYYSSAMSISEVNQVGQYLADKYGLTWTTAT